MSSGEVVLTVTYGDRLDLIQQGPILVAKDLNLKLVIVCNGVSESYRSSLLKIESEDDNIFLIHLEENAGSAQGIICGLDYCCDLDFSHLIILDDDNCIENLGSMNLDKLDFGDASFCVRGGRKYIDAFLKRKDPSNFIAESNSFMGFDFISEVKKRIPFLRGEYRHDERLSFPWAPYGGLILSSKAVKNRDIRPKAEFFLYCDDVEYTSRLSKIYGLRMIRGLVVNDVEDSWNVSAQGNVIQRLLGAKEEWRIYYSVRNQVSFDLCRHKSKMIFLANFISFFFLLYGYSIFSFFNSKCSLQRIRLIHNAVSDGLFGRFHNKGIGW